MQIKKTQYVMKNEFYWQASMAMICCVAWISIQWLCFRIMQAMFHVSFDVMDIILLDFMNRMITQK